MRYREILILCVAAALTFSGCGSNSEKTSEKTASSVQETLGEQETQSEQIEKQEAQKDLFAMDTYMTVSAYGEHAQEAVDQAAQEIERLDALLSTGNNESEIAQLNQNGSGKLSEDAGYLMERSLELYQETDGIFDIAIYPVMEAWGFTTQNYRVPEQQELSELLKLTDVSDIKYNAEKLEVTFGKNGMKVDLGGIAKGYTSSRVMDIFKDCGVKSGLVNLGGNVQALGTKTDGSKWRVAIQSPDDEEDYLGILEIQDKAVITSGGYERYFEQDGKTYHHIIDPATGYPAQNGLISVTIVSEDGTLADGLSTSLFIMGKDEAVSFWREHSEEFDAILETEDKVLYVTEGIAESFTSELQMEIIKK